MFGKVLQLLLEKLWKKLKRNEIESEKENIFFFKKKYRIGRLLPALDAIVDPLLAIVSKSVPENTIKAESSRNGELGEFHGTLFLFRAKRRCLLDSPPLTLFPSTHSAARHAQCACRGGNGGLRRE